MSTLVVLVLLAGVYIISTYLLNGDMCTQFDGRMAYHKKLRDDNRSFYECKGSLYVMDENDKYLPFQDYEKASFLVLPYIFAKDASRVYYVAEIGGEFTGGNEVRIIAGADPLTFEVLADPRSREQPLDGVHARDSRYNYVIHAYSEVGKYQR
jgi:hypothetical protein